MALPFQTEDYSFFGVEPLVQSGEEFDEIDQMILEFFRHFFEVAERTYTRSSYKSPTKKNLKRKPYYPSMYEHMSRMKQLGIPVEAYVRYLFETWKLRRRRKLPDSLVNMMGSRLEGIESPSIAWAAKPEVRQQFLNSYDRWMVADTLSYERGDIIEQAAIEAGEAALERAAEFTGRSREDLLLDLFFLNTLPFSFVARGLEAVRNKFEAIYGLDVDTYLTMRLGGLRSHGRQ